MALKLPCIPLYGNSFSSRWKGGCQHGTFSFHFRSVAAHFHTSIFRCLRDFSPKLANPNTLHPLVNVTQAFSRIWRCKYDAVIRYVRWLLPATEEFPLRIEMWVMAVSGQTRRWPGKAWKMPCCMGTGRKNILRGPTLNGITGKSCLPPSL